MCEYYKNAFGLNYKQITQMPREEFANLYGKQWLAYSPSKFLKMISEYKYKIKKIRHQIKEEDL